MRTICIATAAAAGLVVAADCASAQEPAEPSGGQGRLRITVSVADAQARIVYPVARRALRIAAEAGSPVRLVETGSDGTVETPLAPGAYLVESVDPVPFQGLQLRWSQRVVVTGGTLTSLELTERNAQSTPIPGLGPLVLPFAQYGAPQRMTGGLSVLFPIGRSSSEDGARLVKGLEIQASGGQGGWRAAAGIFGAALPWQWTDVLVTVTRTTSDPRGSSPESIYVGAEAGMAFIVPFWSIGGRSVIMFKPSVGFGHRLDGPSGLKPTMFTWSTGAHVMTIPF
jgi:hypothetical protein